MFLYSQNEKTLLQELLRIVSIIIRRHNCICYRKIGFYEIMINFVIYFCFI